MRVAGVSRRRQKTGRPAFCNSAWRQMQRNILPLARVSGIRCARGQKTIIVADLRRSNTRPKKLNYASKRRSNRLRTIGLRLLSKPNGWSTTAVRNTAVAKNPPRNYGQCRDGGRPHRPSPGLTEFVQKMVYAGDLHDLRTALVHKQLGSVKKAPLLLAGPRR